MNKTLQQHEKEVNKTAFYPGANGMKFKNNPATRTQTLEGDITGLLYTGLGLAGECGEFADKVKKILRDDNGIVSLKKRYELALELGDVFWYLSRCAAELRYDLEMISDLNNIKLTRRLEEGKIKGARDNG